MLEIIVCLPGAIIDPILNQAAFLYHMLFNLLVYVRKQVSDVPDVLLSVLSMIKKLVFEHGCHLRVYLAHILAELNYHFGALWHSIQCTQC